MALSNWDTLAFGNEGTPVTGIFKNHINNSILSIYKNWVLVENKDMWVKDTVFASPIIADVQYGHCTVGGFEIFAARGGQNSVLVMAKYGCYDDGKYRVKLFAGIGAYGFKDNGEWIGISNLTYKEFLDFLTENISKYEQKEMEWLTKIKTERPFRYNQGDAYISNHVGEEIPATELENADQPIMLKILDNGGTE